MHLLRTSGCVPPWQHLKPVLKHIFLRKLTRYDCVPYWYTLLRICFYYIHWLFTFITSSYQLCQSLVIIELYANAVSQLYNSYILMPCMFYLYFMYSAGEHCGSALYKSIFIIFIIIIRSKHWSIAIIIIIIIIIRSKHWSIAIHNPLLLNDLMIYLTEAERHIWVTGISHWFRKWLGACPAPSTISMKASLFLIGRLGTNKRTS